MRTPLSPRLSRALSEVFSAAYSDPRPAHLRVVHTLLSSGAPAACAASKNGRRDTARPNPSTSAPGSLGTNGEHRFDVGRAVEDGTAYTRKRQPPVRAVAGERGPAQPEVRLCLAVGQPCLRARTGRVHSEARGQTGDRALDRRLDSLVQGALRRDEPRRVYRRLPSLRTWSHGHVIALFPARPPLPVGRHPVRRPAPPRRAGTVGCTAETLRNRVRQAERGHGRRAGLDAPQSSERPVPHPLERKQRLTKALRLPWHRRPGARAHPPLPMPAARPPARSRGSR